MIQQKMERRIRWAGIFILAGLVIEVASQFWIHPASFLLVHMAAAGLAALGVGLYLISLVDLPHHPPKSE